MGSLPLRVQDQSGSLVLDHGVGLGRSTKASLLHHVPRVVIHIGGTGLEARPAATGRTALFIISSSRVMEPIARTSALRRRDALLGTENIFMLLWEGRTVWLCVESLYRRMTSLSWFL